MGEKFTDEDLRKYVLGELDESEQARLEEAFFEDDALYERVRAIEEELAESHVRGELGPEARRRFEERLATSHAFAERAGFVRTLVAALDESAAEPSRAVRAAGTWWGRFLETLRLHRAGFVMAAAAVVLVAFSGLWLAREDARPNVPPPETTSATPPQLPTVEAPVGPAAPEPPSPPPPRAAVATFVLAPGVSRGGATPTEVRVPAGARTVRLRLPLEEPVAGDSEAVLRSQEGRVVWRSGRLRARRVADVTVPARLLANGPYLLTLERTTTDGDRETVEVYAFTATRR